VFFGLIPVQRSSKAMGEVEKHKIAIGTYDKALHGFDLFRDEENQVALELVFAYGSEHTGCIKTLAMNTKGTLVSGSTDESIRYVEKMKLNK
jgi:hypothetical protein